MNSMVGANAEIELVGFCTAVALVCFILINIMIKVRKIEPRTTRRPSLSSTVLSSFGITALWCVILEIVRGFFLHVKHNFHTHTNDWRRGGKRSPSD